MASLMELARSSGLTPAKHRPRDSTRSSSLEIIQQHGAGTISPRKRTLSWVEASSSSQNASLHKVKGSSVTKPVQKKRSSNKRSSLWGLGLFTSFFGKKEIPEADNLDGDTLAVNDFASSSAQNDNDLTLVDNEAVHDEGIQLETTEDTLRDYRDEQYLDYDDPRIQDWTREEVWFFNKLNARGAEPLFDETWIMDFPTFPDTLFTTDEDQVFFDNNACSLFRGM